MHWTGLFHRYSCNHCERRSMVAGKFSINQDGIQMLVKDLWALHPEQVAGMVYTAASVDRASHLSRRTSQCFHTRLLWLWHKWIQIATVRSTSRSCCHTHRCLACLLMGCCTVCTTSCVTDSARVVRSIGVERGQEEAGQTSGKGARGTSS